jgi:hypothetical protein
MKNKLFILIIFSLLISSLSLNFILFRFSNSLEKEVQNKQVLVNKIRKGDLTLNDSLRKYSEVINKYVNNCNFEINGKEVSSSELISVLNKQFVLNQKLNDSVVSCGDSLRRSNAIILKAKQDYGINYFIINNSKGFVVDKKYPTRLDSALVLYPHFKDNLKISNDGKNWVITKTVEKTK